MPHYGGGAPEPKHISVPCPPKPEMRKRKNKSHPTLRVNVHYIHRGKGFPGMQLVLSVEEKEWTD